MALETKELQTALRYYKAYKEEDVITRYDTLSNENAVLQDLVLVEKENTLHDKGLASAGVA